MKFVDVKNDVAFRKIFGNENRKESLISFLNAALELEGDQKIVSVEILSPFQFPELNTGKVSILDLRAIDQKKNNYLIEMQVAKEEDLHKRVLYYASKSYTAQIDKGESYPTLNPVVFIGILDFIATKNDDYISRHKNVDIKTGERLITDMEFHFIELPKFNKEPPELTGIIEQWIYFIKNAEDLEVIPEDVTDEGLKIAYTRAEQHNWSKAELEAYEKVSMKEQIDRGRITTAVNDKEKEMAEKARLEREETAEKVRQEKEEMMEKARQEKEEIMEKARQEKEEMAKEFRQKEKENAERHLNSAKIFLTLGISIEDTAKATGLTVEEVKKLKNKK